MYDTKIEFVDITGFLIPPFDEKEIYDIVINIKLNDKKSKDETVYILKRTKENNKSFESIPEQKKFLNLALIKKMTKLNSKLFWFHHEESIDKRFFMVIYWHITRMCYLHG